jgi:6-hydroxy-3-succinoylpyridine 3-monooxygenase
MPASSVIYVDGFNLYYGALRGSRDKWLDLAKLFGFIRQDDDIQLIRYFTARTGSPDQETYLRALATLPRLEIDYGLFKMKTIKCRVGSCSFAGLREFPAPEEKGTDVNIALRMLDDAYQGLCERMVLVSGDSDLVPTVKLVKKRFPNIKITVYIPARDKIRGAARELRGAADKHATLPLNLLAKAQFANPLPDGKGGSFLKPSSW